MIVDDQDVRGALHAAQYNPVPSISSPEDVTKHGCSSACHILSQIRSRATNSSDTSPPYPCA
jgi:hypothetical protein